MLAGAERLPGDELPASPLPGGRPPSLRVPHTFLGSHCCSHGWSLCGSRGARMAGREDRRSGQLLRPARRSKKAAAYPVTVGDLGDRDDAFGLGELGGRGCRRQETGRSTGSTLI